MWLTFSLAALAVGLAMDAVAVAVCQGASGRATAGMAVKLGAAFGGAQALMPLLGWAIGAAFMPLVAAIDHWLALVILVFLGAAMLRQGRRTDGALPCETLAGLGLLAAAGATSIDAMAAGVTLPALGAPVLAACAAIGAVTFLLCAAGTWVGRLAGQRAGKYAEMAGGIILIGLGIRIFVDHQFFGA